MQPQGLAPASLPRVRTPPICTAHRVTPTLRGLWVRTTLGTARTRTRSTRCWLLKVLIRRQFIHLNLACKEGHHDKREHSAVRQYFGHGDTHSTNGGVSK